MSSLKFEVRDTVAPMPVAFATADTATDQFGPTIGRLLGMVGTATRPQGVSQAGAPFCRYTDWRETSATIDVGVPIAGNFETTGDVKAGELGVKGPYLFISYFGPYDKLPDVYGEAEAWMKENGYTWAGAPWDSYVTDPGTEPDSTKWQTDIYIPISKGE